LSQHGSHSKLLATVDVEDCSHGAVDAIIVPTSRPWRDLNTAVDTAAVLNRPMLVLCSGQGSPARAAKMARGMGVEMLVVDVSAPPRSLVPQFTTTRVVHSTEFVRHTDTSFKRNLGLLVSRVVGWERVAFLDDDITVPKPSDLDAAAGLVSEGYAAVGLKVGGFPDNSVVCHAHRETGGDQGTFIGGGALVIGRESMTSFFPTIYNEDWFFLLDDAGLRRSAVTGKVEQKPYDPFANEFRAQMEEFGDCLAEGVFALLDDDGGFEAAADQSYWSEFLHGRMALIDSILHRIRSRGRRDDEALRMEIALRAARKRCEAIPPSLCVRYLKALAQDRRTWAAHVETFPRGTVGLRGSVAALGLTGHATYVAR
jgi:glycosyltransferase involved in cell wall biosynthesis